MPSSFALSAQLTLDTLAQGHMAVVVRLPRRLRPSPSCSILPLTLLRSLSFETPDLMLSSYSAYPSHRHHQFSKHPFPSPQNRVRRRPDHGPIWGNAIPSSSLVTHICSHLSRGITKNWIGSGAQMGPEKILTGLGRVRSTGAKTK